jgi:hypothetical protein
VSGRLLAVSIHDVAPATWTHCRALLALVDALRAGPASLLVVPDYHGRCRVDRDAGFRRAIDRRLEHGDEVALHGYRHVDEAPLRPGAGDRLRRRVYTAGEGEFAALDGEETVRRIGRGLAMLARCGWAAEGFTPPAWLVSEEAAAALACSPLRYLALRDRLVSAGGAAIAGPSLVVSVRSPWRRVLSRVFVDVTARRTAAMPLVRVALHPADAAHPAVMRHWQRALEMLLETRTPVTEGVAAAVLAG